MKSKNSLAQFLAAAAVLGMDMSCFNRAEKPARKCLLKDCENITKHNGGYCCAEHCKTDRERLRKI